MLFNKIGYKPYIDEQKKLEQQRYRSRYGKISYIDSASRMISVVSKDAETGLELSYDLRLALLTPTKSYKPTRNDVSIISYNYNLNYIRSILHRFSGLVAVDIETKGTQAADPSTFIAGIGLADNRNIVYFDFMTNSKEVNKLVLNWLAEYTGGFIGYNVFFDGTFLRRETGKWLDWRYDAFGMYRQLSTEGYLIQKYGLKHAQLNLLGWDEKGDVELDKWLVNNGYVTTHNSFQLNKDNTMSDSEYWEAVRLKVKEGLAEGKTYPALKQEMWRAPAEILGFYCALDAASTYQLVTECFIPSIKDKSFYNNYLEYHTVFLNNVRLLSEQQLNGIAINKQKLEQYHAELQVKITEYYSEFINHDKVRPFITEYNNTVINEIKQAEPEKFKKLKLPKEPQIKIKKDGTISQAWLDWQERYNKILEEGPEISLNWLKWEQKLKAAEQTEHFNVNSGKQLEWLFYDKLNFSAKVFTESGNASTGAKAIPTFGDVGKLLKQYKDSVKEEGYVKKCLEMLIYNPADNSYRIHPQFVAPGTFTGRLAGSGGINLQQLPKSRGYLECWRPEPGKIWVDFDFKALEQVVATELTRDEALLNIYGPEANPAQDVYLFNAALMAKKFNLELFKPLLDAGYNPEFPDADIIKQVKKQYKNLRGISKVATLGKSYGMGWAKFQQDMELQGVNLSEEECRAIIKGLDDLYIGLKYYRYYLEKEWEKNNGWILNGIGRPMGVCDDNKKDLVNRVLQSTGHDILMMWVDIYSKMLDDEGIWWKPIILDFHDETIIECYPEDKQRVINILSKASVLALNRRLESYIPLQVDGGEINTLADAKVED